MSTATAPTAIRIWGREPAAILGLVEAGLVAFVAFQLGVTNESAGLISALVSVLIGAYTAWATKDTLLGVATGLAKAVLALVVYYGVDLTAEQIGAIVTLAPVVVGFWQRTQTNPVGAPVDPSPAQVVPVQPTEDVAKAIIPGTLPADPLDAPSQDYEGEHRAQEYDTFGAPITDTNQEH